MAGSRQRLVDGFWLLVALAIVAGGVVGYRTLGALSPEIEPTPSVRVAPLVETVELRPHDDPIPVRGEGFIAARRSLDLAAQISGRITHLHPAIENRGRFAAGDVLVRLDDSTARAAVTRAEADIASTRARLDLNATRLERAQSLLSRDIISQEQVDELIAEKADLEARIASLGAALDSARIALGDATVRAPFDGAVLSQSAEIGAVVSPGQPIARLFTDDRLEVTVSLGEAEAALIPGLFEDAEAPATITTRFGGRDIAWSGRVDRVDPAIDARTRTLNVTVTLDGHTGTAGLGGDPASGMPPALVNAFAHVTIDGARLDGIYAIPSTALHAGGEVWLLADDTLSLRPAERVHVDGETTYVRIADVRPDHALITSTLDAPVNGMELRVAESDHGTLALREDGR